MKALFNTVLAVAIFLLGFSATGTQAQPWSDPQEVANDVQFTGGRPRIARDSTGRWITVWQRSAGGAALFARSADNAASWAAPAELIPFPGFTSQGFPSITADLGTSASFVAIWSADNGDSLLDGALARSLAGQTTFTAINPLQVNDTFGGLLLPAIQSGSGGVFVAAGASQQNGGPDEALTLLRSINNGSTWSQVARFGEELGQAQADRDADLASDRFNTWVAVWEKRTGPVDNPSTIEVFFSRSGDNGATWTDPAMLNAALPDGRQPSVAADTGGRFIALAAAGTGANSLSAYTSSDGGVTWSTPVAVNPAGPAGFDNVEESEIASDGLGNCVAIWAGKRADSERRRLLYSTSQNSGLSWSAPDYVTTPAATLDVSDEIPQVEYDGAGRWLAVWQRSSFGGTSNTVQIVSAKLVFPVRADLSVSQNASPENPTRDENITFDITVRNDGPSSATGVVLTDTLPTSSAVQLIEQSQGTRTETSDTITFVLGDMPVGATATAKVVLRVRAGAITNVVSVDGNEADLDLDDRVSTASLLVLVDGIELQGEWLSFEPTVPNDPVKGRLKINSQLQIVNLGNQASRGTVLLLMFSDDNVLTDDDAFAGIKRIERIKPGGQQLVNWNIDVARHIPWYGRNVIAIIDAEQRVVEDDETNNVVTSDPLPVP